MKILRTLILAALFIGANASAQEMTALSCNDFRPTNEAIERFPDLLGACEGIVDRDGELYAKFRAVVRRVFGNNVTLYLPATKKTFTAKPDSAARVLIEGTKTRVRDLQRGQEIRIYLAVNEFSKPDIQEVAFVTEEDIVVDVMIEEVPALPTTASPWPAAAAGGLLLLGIGYMMRRRRIGAATPLVALASIGLLAAAPADADNHAREVQIPGKVVTSTVVSMAIVEAVNKETRELKLIDANGKRYTVKASDLVRNFDQIEPRDRIIMEYLESVAVFVVPSDAPELPDAAAIEVAPLGDKPGLKAADTFMVKATIESLNVSDRIAIIRGENGQVRTVKLANDVPLDMVNVGDEVRLRITQALAVNVRKADKS